MTIVDKQKTGNKRQNTHWHWVGNERWIHEGTRQQKREEAREQDPNIIFRSEIQNKHPPAKQHLQAISSEQGKFPRRTWDRLITDPATTSNIKLVKRRFAQRLNIFVCHFCILSLTFRCYLYSVVTFFSFIVIIFNLPFFLSPA